MRRKKHFIKDLNQKRGLFFALGLVIILATTYLAFEWKTPEDNDGYQLDSDSNKEILEKDSSVILETKATKKPPTEG